MGRAPNRRKAAGGDAGVVQSGADVLTGDPLDTDLQHFHPQSESFDELPKGGLAVVKRIAPGIHGDVFRCLWAQGEQGEQGEMHVAVKKLHAQAVTRPSDVEQNERNVHLKLGGRRKPCQEDPLTEIGVLQYLSKQSDTPDFLLRLHGIFCDSHHAWLVTEYADGGEMFDEVTRHGRLPESRVKRCTSEILEAVRYLHAHDIGHRDISLENVLLKNGVTRLMDFGMAAQTRRRCGTRLRYFRAVGKDFYRAPECYVPRADYVEVRAPEGARPNSVVSTRVGGAVVCEVLLPKTVTPGKRCAAKVYGYEIPPADVFSTGVCLSIMLTGRPLWSKAVLSDNRFAWAADRDVVQLQSEWGLAAPHPELAALMRRMMAIDPVARCTAEECLSSPWLADLSCQDEPVDSASTGVDPTTCRAAGA